MPPVSSCGNSAEAAYEYQTSGCVTGGRLVAPVLCGDWLTGLAQLNAGQKAVGRDGVADAQNDFFGFA